MQESTQAELGVLGDVALHEDRGPLGVDAAGEVLRRRTTGPLAQPRGVHLHGDGVQVDDAVEGVVALLQAHPVHQRAEVVAEVQRVVRRLHAREDARLTGGLGGFVLGHARHCVRSPPVAVGHGGAIPCGRATAAAWERGASAAAGCRSRSNMFKFVWSGAANCLTPTASRGDSVLARQRQERILHEVDRHGGSAGLRAGGDPRRLRHDGAPGHRGARREGPGPQGARRRDLRRRPQRGRARLPGQVRDEPGGEVGDRPRPPRR